MSNYLTALGAGSGVYGRSYLSDVDCPECDGTGADPDDVFGRRGTCETCKGRGAIERPDDDAYDRRGNR